MKHLRLARDELGLRVAAMQRLALHGDELGLRIAAVKDFSFDGDEDSFGLQGTLKPDFMALTPLYVHSADVFGSV